MKIQIVGNGAFGSFLVDLFKGTKFQVVDNADTVILAVPASAYPLAAKEYFGKHLINVCSVQSPTTKACQLYSAQVTSIHPLFGRRTPNEYRYAIFTHSANIENDTWAMKHEAEAEFMAEFSLLCGIQREWKGKSITPEMHDMMMEKTHVAAVMAAKQMQVYTDRANDIPDELVPHSFRMMRRFVQTLEDMPKGTITSILANPYL